MSDPDCCPECGAEEPDWNAARAFDKQDELRDEIKRLRARVEELEARAAATKERGQGFTKINWSGFGEIDWV
jgi:hypothetical protein